MQTTGARRAFREGIVIEAPHEEASSSRARVGPAAVETKPSLNWDTTGTLRLPVSTKPLIYWRTRHDSNVWPLPSEGNTLVLSPRCHNRYSPCFAGFCPPSQMVSATSLPHADHAGRGGPRRFSSIFGRDGSSPLRGSKSREAASQLRG